MNTRNKTYLRALELGLVAVHMTDGSYSIMGQDSAEKDGHGPWIVTELQTVESAIHGKGYVIVTGRRLA
jgi:hypothetical protein